MVPSGVEGAERRNLVSDLPAADPAVGLCSICVHARKGTNARGSTFWQCRAARENPELRRYPELPILSCVGFERIPDED
jgi:hypothetical protein